MSIWFKRASERGYDKVRDGIAPVLADLSESLQGVRIVTAHNRQRYNVETPSQHRRLATGTPTTTPARINGVYGPGSQVISVFGQAAHPGHRRHHVPAPPAGDQPRPADGVLPLREPVLLADSAAGAAVQHRTSRAGRRCSSCAACSRPSRRCSRRPTPSSCRRSGARSASTTSRSATTRPCRCCTTSTSRSRPARRWRSSAPPGPASRRWPSWSPASTTRPRAGC